MIDEKTLGQKIVQLRKKQGWTQQKLAEIVNVSFMTIRRWENSETYPRIDEIKTLCEVFNCTETELLSNDVSDDWELKLVIKKEGDRSMINITGTTATATLEMSDFGMGITLSAGYDLWRDDEKFEKLIEDLRKKRIAGLKTYDENW